MSAGALLLINPHAGRVGPARIGAVVEALQAAGPLEVAITGHEAEVDGVLDRLGGRRLFVLGGDGTINVTANRLCQLGMLEVDVVLLPAGTADAGARGLGLPLDAAEAARTLAAAPPRGVDLIVASDGRVAVNDAHTGLGVPATRIARKLKVIGGLAYPIANSLVGLRSGGWAATVSVDGRTLVDNQRVLAVAVGNTPVIGDGTPMWPAAEPDDGALDVMVLLAGPRASRLRLALELRRGEHGGRDDVRHGRGGTVTVAGELPGYNADGELWLDLSTTSLTVLPAALQLVR